MLAGEPFISVSARSSVLIEYMLVTFDSKVKQHLDALKSLRPIASTVIHDRYSFRCILVYCCRAIIESQLLVTCVLKPTS